MGTEIELKYPLKNKEKIIEILESVAEEINGEEQKDIYYSPNHKNFLEKKPVSEWLRLRESKNKDSINYKKWHNEKGNTIHCDEFETIITNINELKEILKRLDFTELIIVDKKRINWKYKNTIISIDTIMDLGDFIEIELIENNFESIDNAKDHLQSILKEINAELGEQDFEGYPYLLLKKKNLI